MSKAPKKPLHRLLFALSGGDNAIGRSSRRKLMRRLPRKSLADFDARLALLTPGDICIDLGANLGLFTEKLAQTGAQVHAYEPDPHYFAILQKRFAGQSNVHLHNVAVSAVAGTAILRRARGFEAAPDLMSQSSSIAVLDEAKFDLAGGIAVETRAFADVVNDFDRPVTLVKMDIEMNWAGRLPFPIDTFWP